MTAPNDITIKLGLDDTGLPAPVRRTTDALAAIGKAGEVSARQTAQAMRQLPAQFTDIATSLAGGQNPLLVLLQQGGQIKDSFGGVREAVSAVAASISPTALAVGGLAAGVGVLVTGFVQGARESASLRDAVALTGNAAGLTATRFDMLAKSTANAAGISVGASRDIVLELARTGQVSASTIDAVSVAVGRVAAVTGQDSKKIAADFATMQSGVANWAAEHNKAWNFITADQYRYIKQLEEQGKAEEAQIFVSQRVIDQLGQQRENLGGLESAWKAVSIQAKNAWDRILDIGRDPSELDRLNSARSRQGIAMNVQGTPILEWLFGTPGEAEEQVRAANMDLLRSAERAMDSSSRALLERQRIAREREAEGERKRQAEAAAREAERERQRLLRAPGVDLEILDARDARLRQLNEAAANDPLGDFLTEQVLPADQRRNDARLNQQRAFLESLSDANERAGAALLDGELARGERLIEIDRQIALRRLEAQGLTAEGRAEAERLINEKAGKQRRQLEIDADNSARKVAERAGEQTYNDVRGALAAAFQDTQNPAKAFAQALGSAVFSRVSAGLSNALATALVGADGKGGLLSLILQGFQGVQGGGIAVDAQYSTGLPLGGFDRPGEGLATGTNYVPRNMVARLHEGEAVVPKKYNPAAGGHGAGLTYHQTNHYTVDSRSDRADIVRMMHETASRQQQEMLEYLQARGVLVA